MKNNIFKGLKVGFKTLLSWFSYTSGFLFWLFFYLPFGLTVRIVSWSDGVNEKSLLSFKGFLKFYRQVFFGILFPKIDFFFKLGHIFVLPFIKGGIVREGGDDNGASSMLIKYFDALKDGRKVLLAPEYLDAIHKKYILFLVVTGALTICFYALLFLGFAEVFGAYLAMSFMQLVVSLGSMFAGWLGADADGLATTSMVGSIFNLLMSITIWYVMFHILVVGLVIVYSFFKEIRTMQNIGNFAKESAKMVYYSLKAVHKDNAQMETKVDEAMNYLVESCKMDTILNDEFVKIDESYFIKYEPKKIEHKTEIENN